MISYGTPRCHLISRSVYDYQGRDTIICKTENAGVADGWARLANLLPEGAIFSDASYFSPPLKTSASDRAGRFFLKL